MSKHSCHNQLFIFLAEADDLLAVHQSVSGLIVFFDFAVHEVFVWFRVMSPSLAEWDSLDVAASKNERGCQF